jgi:UDP-N-acetylglucosamine--N-acetylmuramyl-(pentapeptide) pyrophosphoryl-undecaprenol N-acetylglucosamine transferase
LARFSDRIALSFAATSGVPEGRKRVLTGNPVRAAITAREKAAYVAAEDNLKLLVLGGSLGAQVFATLIPAALGYLPAALLGRISLTMQCPAASIETARAALLACGVTAMLEPFFADVAELMAEAHLVVARAGGSTVAELAVIGRPAVLIPLRINDDQPANADALAAAGGAVRVEQSDGAEALASVLKRLLNEPARLVAMADAARRMGIVDAAERLADVVQKAVVKEAVI